MGTDADLRLAVEDVFDHRLAARLRSGDGENYRAGAAPLQEAAVTALEFAQGYYADLLSEYTRKRDLFLGYLARTGLPFTTPEGAYYTLVDISSLGFANDRTAAEEITKRVGVTGVPGSSFFREPVHNYIRFHFAKKDETLQQAGERIVEKLAKCAL